MGGEWVEPVTLCIPVIVMREHEPLLNADLVIFDCDGVLVDSEPTLCERWPSGSQEGPRVQVPLAPAASPCLTQTRPLQVENP
jgi:hypothetical protein